MASKPVVVVVGATGSQGGSVADFLVKENKYHVRGLTRKPDGDAANKLKAKGVEVVVGDVSKKEDLAKAFHGAWAVFALTQFWEHGAEKEVEQGKLMADVAKEQGVKVFIYGGLANVKKISGGKLHVSHFTGKAEIEEYARTKGFDYTSFPQPACYLENFTFFFVPKEKDGVWELAVPINGSAPVDWISIRDYGASVVAVLNDLKKYNGRSWAVTSERASFQQQVDALAKVTGKKTHFISVPYDAAVAAGQKELAEMFLWFEQYGYYGPGFDLKEFKAVYPQARGFEQFLKETKFMQ